MLQTMPPTPTSPEASSARGTLCHHNRWHPTSKILEFVLVTDDLATRISKQNHVAVFASQLDYSGIQPPATKGNSIFVQLPFEFQNTAPALGSTGRPRWEIIVRQLLKLKTITESGVTVPNMAQIMCDTISEYCPNPNQYSNFYVLNDATLGEAVITALPKIILLAIQLPILLAKPIPVLKTGESQTIYMTRKVAASLLANAFLCTFPEAGKAKNGTPDFNFFTLFHMDPRHPTSVNVKREKLRCILNYFEKISSDTSGFQQIISYERRCIRNKTNWSGSQKPLCAVIVDSQQKIENCKGMLQVDFANRAAGGGVYKEGCVMEDIRFCISPELLVARLFMQNLGDDEVYVITGTEIYSQYSGYGATFQYKGPAGLNFGQATDTLGRTFTQLVAMDAQFFPSSNKQQQF